MRPVATEVFIGSLRLANPIVAASGTFGTGTELKRFVNPADLGAVTVKSLSAFPWGGNSAPRLTPTPAGMLNAVGLQNPGVTAWLEKSLPQLRASGATVIASIWGRTVEEFAEAAALLIRAEGVAAVEVNLSCPNLESASQMFAHSSAATTGAIEAVARELAGTEKLLLAKLSPNTTDIVQIARAAIGGGANALTLVNTLIGMKIAPGTARPILARSPSGLSGPAIRPIAVRCVYEVSRALPDTPIIGTGGVVDGASAAEMMAAGASAVGVGTATFFDPCATVKIRDDLVAWCRRHSVREVAALTRRSHRGD